MHCNEVQDLNHAFELDVGRLQIAMHDVLFVVEVANVRMVQGGDGAQQFRSPTEPAPSASC
jgi:hypothetical protein